MKVHTLVLGALATNCYIWEDENTKNAIVIDPADNGTRILNYAKEKGITITDIILTHGHFDHVLALKELKELTGARLSVFEKTPEFLKDESLNLAYVAGVKVESVKADVLLRDKSVIDFNGNLIQVIHTPGHTADSICLYLDDVLICGDTIFKSSVGRGDFPTGSLVEEVNSIKTKLMVLADSTKVYSGHGESTTIGEEKRGNPYLI